MKIWQSGETAALRGMSDGMFWSARSTYVIHDQPDELALLLLPGAECAAPWGYIHQKHGDHSAWDRWGDEISRNWKIEKYTWRQKRCVILMQPDQYYSTLMMWDHQTGEFLGYYVNFEIPYTRSPAGFDTHDLELDIEIGPSLTWEWKDQAEYNQGIELGVITEQMQKGIAQAVVKVLEKLGKHLYPFDNSWLERKIDFNQKAPVLPAGWDIDIG
ncbi:MAG: DUF402 domain-containing protein [Chloroflexota bacterium]